ncbi:MAG: Cd(II)/Pb(II)-responsive transcriptional regulator [Pseudomonadota bacterium]
MSEALKIGELAGRLSVPVETIRYYEKEGLLPSPARTAGNYRLYDQNAVERLTFIRNCRTLGMNLGEVRALLRAKDQPDIECGSVNHLIDTHIAQIDERIAAMLRLKGSLTSLRMHCGSARVSRDCGILSELAHCHDPHSPCHANVSGDPL